MESRLSLRAACLGSLGSLGSLFRGLGGLCGGRLGLFDRISSLFRRIGLLLELPLDLALHKK